MTEYKSLNDGLETVPKDHVELYMLNCEINLIHKSKFKDYEYANDVFSIKICNLDIEDNFIFSKYEKLKSIWGNSPTIKTKNLSRLFYGSKLIDGNLNYWDVSKVTNMESMFIINL